MCQHRPMPYIIKDNEKMKKSMSIIVVSYIYLFVLGTVFAVLIGVPLLRVIKPGISISSSIILGLCVFQFMMKLRNCYTSYFSCTNRINYMAGFIVSSFLTIILSFLFTGYMSLGMWGLILAQIVSQSVYNVWHWPVLAHKELECSFFDLMKMGNKNILSFLRR